MVLTYLQSKWGNQSAATMRRSFAVTLSIIAANHRAESSRRKPAPRSHRRAQYVRLSKSCMAGASVPSGRRKRRRESYKECGKYNFDQFCDPSGAIGLRADTTRRGARFRVDQEMPGGGILHAGARTDWCREPEWWVPQGQSLPRVTRFWISFVLAEGRGHRGEVKAVAVPTEFSHCTASL